MALPAPLATLSSLVREKPECLGIQDKEIHDASLNAAKYLFDRALHTESRAFKLINDLLTDLASSNGPETRSKARRDAKTTIVPPSSILQPTPLLSLHIDGMVDEQIWSQLELRADPFLKALQQIMSIEHHDEMTANDNHRSSEEEYDFDSLDEMDLDDSDESITSPALEEGLSEGETSSAFDDEEHPSNEHIDTLKDSTSDEEGSTPNELDGLGTRKLNIPSGASHPELDDGFFSISDFNAETEESEARRVSIGKLDSDDDTDDGLDADNVDLFALVHSQDSAFDEEDLESADISQAYYRDFFAPPRGAKQPPNPLSTEGSSTNRESKVKFHDEVRVKKIKAENRGRSVHDLQLRVESKEQATEDMESDDEPSIDGSQQEELDSIEAREHGREVIGRFEDDLFGDDTSSNEPNENVSSHEARMASISSRILELEAENVGEKEWTRLGEVTSRKRPHNSLLEEDLDFEQVQRPVNSVTTEQISSLEEKIKSRILESRFDDVEHKRTIDAKDFLPSRYFELKATKSHQSLSQLYEDEYMADRSGQSTNDVDARLQKEHQELEVLWESISSKLDALCNAHFTPKQPKALISTLSNVATASIESAMPTSKAIGTMMAPEEIFRPKSNDLTHRSELTSSEKRASRVKEKKDRQKARERLGKVVTKGKGGPNREKALKSVKRAKEEALKTVVKSGKGITVVGKKDSHSGSKGKERRLMDSGTLKL